MEMSKQLNILMVTPRYYPFMGGIETHVYEVGRRLARLGHHITILTTMLATPLPREEESEGMHIRRVQAWPRQRDYYLAPELRAIIKQGQWDLVHCQGCHTFVAPLAMLAAREARLPYLLTFHTGGHSSPLRNSIRGLQWRLLRPLMARAAHFIGVSQFEADYFRQKLHLPAEKFTVIPNGATLPTLLVQSPLPPDQTLIASVGRLERFKGHQHLITALPHIRSWRPNARLLIVGAGPYEHNLRALAQQVGVAAHVEIRTIPAHERLAMAELLAQTSLVALLSECESHPIAVMEALSLRRPVLVTATSGLQEIAEQGLARAIPLHSSPGEVARAVQQQIEEPVLPPASFALPTWDSCANQLQDVYQNLVRRLACVS